MVVTSSISGCFFFNISFWHILPSFHLSPSVYRLAIVSLNMFIIILISRSRISPTSLFLDAIAARVIIFEGVMLSWFFLFLSLVHWKLGIGTTSSPDLVFSHQLYSFSWKIYTVQVLLGWGHVKCKVQKIILYIKCSRCWHKLCIYHHEEH